MLAALLSSAAALLRNQAAGYKGHSVLEPNYQGTQTYGLEMESSCKWEGTQLEHAIYGSTAMLVYRRVSISSSNPSSNPIGMVEIEAGTSDDHKKLEFITFPAHADDTHAKFEEEKRDGTYEVI